MEICLRCKKQKTKMVKRYINKRNGNDTVLTGNSIHLCGNPDCPRHMNLKKIKTWEPVE